jgi:hypothetical protein
MAKKKTKKQPTQVAFVPPAIGYPLIGAAGLLTSKAVDKFLEDADDDEVEQLKKMIDEETKKAKKKGLKGGIETDAVRLKAARKGGLIRSKPKRDGIAKKGKTKGRIIRGVLNK